MKREKRHNCSIYFIMFYKQEEQKLQVQAGSPEGSANGNEAAGYVERDC